MVSSDDDMRPWAYMEDSPESLAPDEICRGKLLKAGTNGYTRKSFDILTAFLDVLGKTTLQAPDNYEHGELLIDTATELETNTSKEFVREHSILLKHGSRAADAVVKIAQTFRSGTNDSDALDFVEMFLDDNSQKNLEDLNNICAGEFPASRNQHELADGLRCRGVRKNIGFTAVLSDSPTV